VEPLLASGLIWLLVLVQGQEHFVEHHHQGSDTAAILELFRRSELGDEGKNNCYCHPLCTLKLSKHGPLQNPACLKVS